MDIDFANKPLVEGAINSTEAIPCSLPSCKVRFTPRQKGQGFHSPACKKQFEHEVYLAGRAAMEKRKGTHFAIVSDSKRLQKVLAVLKRGGKLTLKLKG